MRLLEERIQRDGIVKSGDVLKVDSFLNHQMDVALFEEMALEWKRAFDGKPINKILTIEASGIGIAAIVARVFNVPVVFAKKAQSINLDGTGICHACSELHSWQDLRCHSFKEIRWTRRPPAAHR